MEVQPEISDYLGDAYGMPKTSDRSAKTTLRVAAKMNELSIVYPDKVGLASMRSFVDIDGESRKMAISS